MKISKRLQPLFQFVLVYLMLWLISGCSVGGAGSLQQENLVGQIWDSQAEKYIEKNQFMQNLLAADYVLLGETHDNPQHHKIEEEVLQALVLRKNVPALVLEMLDVDDQPKIDHFLKMKSKDTAEFNLQTGFAKKGWDWPMYRPLIEIALDHQLTIIAGNLSREQLMTVIKNGISDAPQEVRLRLEKSQALKPGQQRQLKQDIRDSHCGKLPEKMVPGMANAQITRDIMLAEQVAAAGKPALLIAGSGHVRRDRSVPFYLSQIVSGSRIVAIGLLEVDGNTKPAHLATQKKRFDYLWYTKPAEREDLCAGFKVSQ